MKRLLPALLLFLLFLPSCQSNAVPAPPFENKEVTFIGEYMSDGAVFRARFSLPAGEGTVGGAVTLLSPDRAAEVTYRMAADGAHAIYGAHDILLSSPPLPLSLLAFCRPPDAALGASQTENGVRTQTYLSEGKSYLYRTRVGEPFPYEIEAKLGGVLYTLRILSCE